MVKWHGKNVKALHELANSKGIFVVGTAIVSQAVLLCPVVTGDLMGSIMARSYNARSGHAPNPIHAPREKEAVNVGSNLSYAAYVEYGTKKKAARPYLRPAIDLVFGTAADLYTKEYKKNRIKEYLVD